MDPELTDAPASSPAPEAPSMFDAVKASVMQEAPAAPAAPVEAIEGEAPEAPVQDGRLRDAQGRFIAKDGTVLADQGPKPVAPAQPKLEQPKAEVKPKEELLTPPEGISQVAKQRFEKLVGTNKELTARVEQFAPKAEAFDAFQQVLSEHQVQEEQFQSAVTYIGAVNRGDLRGALKILDDERAAIAQHLGMELPGVDLIGDFPDLQQAVEGYQMPREKAIELATARRQQQALLQQHEQQQMSAQQQQQFTQLRNHALSEIDQFMMAQSKNDLAFDAVNKAITEQVIEAVSELPPHMWANTVKRMYATAKQALANGGYSAPSDAPLRPAGNGGGVRPQPASMLDAISGGLGR